MWTVDCGLWEGGRAGGRDEPVVNTRRYIYGTILNGGYVSRDANAVLSLVGMCHVTRMLCYDWVVCFA